MIDDAKVRLSILKSIPKLEPWRIEMEEIDFGDAIGCSVLIGTTRRRFKTTSFTVEGRRTERPEPEIASDLSKLIKTAMEAESGSDPRSQG